MSVCMYVENAGKKNTWSIKFYYFYFHRICKKNINYANTDAREGLLNLENQTPFGKKTPNKRFKYFCKNDSNGFDQIYAKKSS